MPTINRASRIIFDNKKRQYPEPRADHPEGIEYKLAQSPFSACKHHRLGCQNHGGYLFSQEQFVLSNGYQIQTVGCQDGGLLPERLNEP